MQFVVKRDILLKSLNFVQGVVEKKNTLPILSNVLLQLKDKKHLEIDSKDLKTTTEKAPGSFYAIVSEMSLETIYLRLFPKTNKDDLGIAIQKAASHGLLICEKKFYDSDNEIILWDSLQKYID